MPKSHDHSESEGGNPQKEIAEIYKIYRNGRLFAVFYQGDMSRFGKVFDGQIALREFRQCIDKWKSPASSWELRISVGPAKALTGW